MIRVFRHFIPKSVIALGVLDIMVLFAAHYGGYYIRVLEMGKAPSDFTTRLGDATHFVLVMTLAMLALGLYERQACRDLRVAFLRLSIVFVVGFLWFSAVFYLIPNISEWRSVFVISYSLAFAGLFLARILFARVVDFSVLKQRLLVLGAGPRAARVRDLEEDGLTRGFTVAGFLRMNPNERALTQADDFSSIDSLVEHVRRKRVDEIVTATEERRGSLPVRELLDCKLAGIAITDYSSFVERETGVVEVDSLNPSWLIYSDGFAGGRFDRILKRVFDIMISLLFLLFTLPVLLVVAALVWGTSLGPVFYRQKRVGQHGKTFMLLKFRSMRVDAESAGTPQWAAENDPRTTAIGGIMRVTRIDELPQIFNVLRGDMSFVGPRPERPFFVNSLAEELPYYSERHQVKPGITGWAQLNYPYGASVADAKEKLQYDLYYVKNCNIFIDFLILIQTARVILFASGAR